MLNNIQIMIFQKNKLEMNFKPSKHELYLLNKEKEREKEREEREI